MGQACNRQGSIKLHVIEHALEQVHGVLVVGQIKAALEKRLGRKVALASAYNLLHRHNWRQARARQAPPPK
jgi:Winged helix-turn helix